MTNINYSLSQAVGYALAERQLKLALAESCTGGGLSEEITAVAGSSAWFDRGFVTYSNRAKQEQLEVDEKTLIEHGAVSLETAKEMALGVLKHSAADYALSITGIAGPIGGTPEKPVGTVWFGLASRNDVVLAREAFFTGGRKNVRSLSIEFALKWLLEELNS